MKKIGLMWIVFIVVFGITASGHAAGVMPETFFGPEVGPYPPYGQAVKLEVGAASGDSSWMAYHGFGDIAVDDIRFINVVFDDYRYANSNHSYEWLYWGFDYQGGTITPSYGGQNEPSQASGFNTYPFIGAAGGSGFASSELGTYATVDLTWDFESGICYSYYNESEVDDGVPFSFSSGGTIDGFSIHLNNLSGIDGETAWIDNFWIYIEFNDEESSFIEYYTDFESGGFNEGGLDGIEGWSAGAGNGAVPIPGTIWLLGGSLLGLVHLRGHNLRKSKSPSMTSSI